MDVHIRTQLTIDDYFGVAIEYYKNSQFPAIRLLWPDNANRFPWEAGFALNLMDKQLLLGRKAAFKFRENWGGFSSSLLSWIAEKDVEDTTNE